LNAVFLYLIIIEDIFMSDEESNENNTIEKNNIDFKEFVKIYSNASELIPLLGSVFHNEKSREMWLLMSSHPEKEFYLKEMAVIIENNENPKLPNYEYHISNMVEAGIVLVRIKLHNKHMTKFYRAAPVIMLTNPQLYEKANKSKTLKNTFNKVFKFVAIGGVALSSHYFVEFFSSSALSSGSPNYTIPLLVIIFGLTAERVYSHFRLGYILLKLISKTGMPLIPKSKQLIQLLSTKKSITK